MLGNLATKVVRGIKRLLPARRDGSVWCLVANVAANATTDKDGKEVKRGTKHFSAGTLVYCSTELWGDGYEKIKIIARHRGSKRFVTMVLPSSKLTNWRVKLVYQPHVIREFKKLGAKWDDSKRSKQLAEEYVARMNKAENPTP